MKLLLDAGNSRLKWAAVDSEPVPLTGVETPDEPGLLRIADRLTALTDPQGVALLNVRGQGFVGQVRALCARQGWPDPLIIETAREGHGITTRYRHPERLGVDRFAAMVAARRLFAGPLLVVDCGTAVTLDAVDAHGGHLGGLILPGLRLMREVLSSGAAALPPVDAGPPETLARDTESAMVSGSLLGLCGAVDGLCERLASRFPDKPTRVITGGDAALIVEYSTLRFELCPWLTLQGAYFIMEGGTCDPWRSS